MPLPQRTPIYQYHSAQANGDGWRFLFSQNPNEGNSWTYDNIAWYAYPDVRTVNGNPVIPIYQHYAVQTNGDGWRFMLSQNPNPPSGSIADGIAFYAFATPLSDSVAIYQYHCNQQNGDGTRYTFATSPTMGLGWICDGPAFYCPPAPGSESAGPAAPDPGSSDPPEESSDDPPTNPPPDPGNSSSFGGDEEEEEW